MKIVTEADYLLIQKAKKQAESIKKIKKLNKELSELLKNIVENGRPD